MLNTDLNNPAITPKITLAEYVASCHRCTPLRDVP
jgi:Sec7-like guanine-nucleotide exchange factor